MSTVPIIASVGDLDWAIRRAERATENRAYVATRAVELGAAHRIPGSWGPVRSLVSASVSTKEREKAADKGQAMPDGSFPIRNVSDLDNAVSAYGRAKDKAAAKRHIIKRARALHAIARLPEGWGVTASITAAGWSADLHPRDRNGKFIEKLGLLNLFDGDGFGKPSMRAEAVGVHKSGNKDVLTVRAKSVGKYDGKARAVGDEFDVDASRVESAPDAKAKMTHPVFTGEVKPKGEVIKGEATDLKKAQDRADAAASELADAEASGDKARITKARTSNTAAQKNLVKQQGLEDTAGDDLTRQLEESIAQLDKPDEGVDFDSPDAQDAHDEELASTTKLAGKAGGTKGAVANILEEETGISPADLEKDGYDYEDVLNNAEAQGYNRIEARAALDELMRDAGNDPDADGGPMGVPETENPTGLLSLDEGSSAFDDPANDQTIADVYDRIREKGLNPDTDGEMLDEVIDREITAGNTDPDSIAQKATDEINFGVSDDAAFDEDPEFVDGDTLDDGLGPDGFEYDPATLQPAEDWDEGDSPIDDEVEYGKTMHEMAGDYTEALADEGGDAQLDSLVDDLRLALQGDVNDPQIRGEVRARADAVRDHLTNEEYAADYELPEFGGGPAANHGVSDELDDSTPFFDNPDNADFGGMTPSQKAADQWENDNHAYLESLDEDTRAEIESAIADEDWVGAVDAMDANYEYGHGNAIDEFREKVVNKEAYDVSQKDAADTVYTELVDIFGQNPDADPDEVGRELMDRGHTPDAVDAGMERYRSDNGPSESAIAQQFSSENPTPTTDLYAADDPEIQKAFDEWADGARAGGMTDEQIAARVDYAESTLAGSWKALDVADATDKGKSNAQYGGSRDRLEKFPVGNPGAIGFGGYEVWHTNPDGSKNGGRGNFPDAETAQAFIDASTAEYDRKLQDRLDAAPGQIDKWAENKSEFTVQQAMLNIDASMVELNPQDPDDADQIRILNARRDRMAEILKKAPDPESTDDFGFVDDGTNSPVPSGAKVETPDVKAPVTPGASPQRSAIELSLGNSASNKGLEPGSFDAIFSASSPDEAHKAMATEMTRLKLGGKQRKRMRELLDLHFGSESDSSAVSAKATADALAPDNPLKAKLEAAVAKAAPEAPDVAAPDADSGVKAVAARLDSFMNGAGPSGVDWLGYGYLRERGDMPNTQRYEADAMVEQRTKGWSDEELFAWANSKAGRYFGEAVKSNRDDAADYIKKQMVIRRVPESSVTPVKSVHDVKDGDRVYSMGSYYDDSVEIMPGTVIGREPTTADSPGYIFIRLDDGSTDSREYWHVAKNPESAPDF